MSETTRADWTTSDGIGREWTATEIGRPLGPMVLVIVAVMVASAAFWVGFMLAPAAVLLIGYLALSAGDKARRQRLAAPRAAAEPRVTGPRGMTERGMTEPTSVAADSKREPV